MKECPRPEHLASLRKICRDVSSVKCFSVFNYDKAPMPYLQRLNTLKEMIAPTMMYKQATSQVLLTDTTEFTTSMYTKEPCKYMV